MIKLLICGICGKMGRQVYKIASADGDICVVGGVDSAKDFVGVPVYGSFGEVNCTADVVVDFSSPSALEEETEWAKRNGAGVVLAATGYTDGQLKYIGECAREIAVFKTANFSVGINLMAKLVRKAAETLGGGFDIEICEKHHRFKADAPSGTAKMLAEAANSAFSPKKPYLYGREGIVGARGGEIGIHAIRGGTIVGEHEVMFAGEDEVLTITHSAQSKNVFAAGAVRAAKWLYAKPAGLYDMDNLLQDLF